MTDRDIERLYMDKIEEEKPDLWDRIEKSIDEEMPEVKMAETENKKGFFKKLKGFFFGGSTLKAAVSVCCLCLIIAGAGKGLGSIGMMGRSSSAEAYDGMAVAEAAAEDYDYGMEYSDESAGSAEADSVSEAAAQEAGSTDRKLIRTVDLYVETLNFDDLIGQLQQQTEAAGGYVESSSIEGSSYSYDSQRWATLVLRIPQDQTDDFLSTVGGEANVVSKSENTEDVTLTYVDIESHVKALETEEETLLGLLEKAEDVSTVIEIQNELSNVRYELESYKSQLKSYDNLIDYDTINISISEVEKETPLEEQSIPQRIASGLQESFETLGIQLTDLFVNLVIALPFLAVLFILIFVIIFVIRKIIGRKKK